MSKNKTKPEDIRDQERYFNKYIAMEAKHDNQEQGKYYHHFLSLDQILEENAQGDYRKETYSFSLEDQRESFFSHVQCKTEEEWAASMNNDRLSSAFLKLTRKQKKILFLRFYKQMTYREIQGAIGVSHQAVEKEEKKAIKKLGKIMG